MKTIHFEDLPSTAVDMEGSAGCRIRCLIGPDDGAPSFSMRQFELAPGGHTPQHTHAHEHEVFVLLGFGRRSGGCGRAPVAAGNRRVRRAERAAPVPQHGQRPHEIPLLDPAPAPRHGGALRSRLRLRVTPQEPRHCLTGIFILSRFEMVRTVIGWSGLDHF